PRRTTRPMDVSRGSDRCRRFESLKYRERLSGDVSQQVAQVETLFAHGIGDGYLVAVTNGGERTLSAKLELHETDAGPRPAKFAIKHASGEEPRSPDQFVELARRADRIRVSEQTPRTGRDEFREMLSGYQLDA